MKKIFIAAIAVLGFTTANAQYIAEKGDFQTSIDFRPFQSSGDVFSNEVGNTVGVNFGYFVSDKSAIRLGLGFGINSTKDTSSDGKFAINVGYENHFKSYDRLDLYAGAQVGFATGWGKEKYATYNDEGEKNGTIDVKTSNPREFSVYAFTGANYYLYKKLYVGAEIQLGYANTSYSKGQHLEGDKVVDNKEAATKSSNKFGFKVLPAFRLGWTF